MGEKLTVGGVEHVFNGGPCLPGAPESWGHAREWEMAANDGELVDAEGNDRPMWRFDCGFKLDFDGPLISVSSRFYPPAEHYGPKWDGVCEVIVLGQGVVEKKFEEDTLDELKVAVEGWVRGWVHRFREVLIAEEPAEGSRR